MARQSNHRILFVPYGTEKAPATRYRVSQYLRILNERGIKYRLFSAISPLATNLMINSPDFHVMSRFFYYVYVLMERILRSFVIIFMAGGYDIIYLQRTTFPLGLERVLNCLKKKIIFDIDDAIFMTDTDDNSLTTRIKKRIKESEVVNILRCADCVIVENEYIKNFVMNYCESIVKIPGPIDTERYFPKERREKRAGVVIGWIGSPATTVYLNMLNNVFRVIQEKYGHVGYKFIGLGNYENRDIRYEKIKWEYDTELKNLQDFDIGIMPMPDDNWTRGKLGCKMLQYMAVGIPCVVSYTPTNAEIIKDNENGFFAASDKEWIDALSRLIEDDGLRARIGQRGRGTVLDKCSLSANVSKLLDVFTRL